MLKKIISLLVIFAMLVPFSSAVAADEPTSQPSIEEILNEYHQKAFEAQPQDETNTAATYSRQATGSSKTLEQETVDTLTEVGYEAYNVTADNYTSLEADLNTDFAEMGLDPDGSYIIVISGEGQNSQSNPNSRSGNKIEQVIGGIEGGGSSNFYYTYGDETYLMRYITVTSATNSNLNKSDSAILFEDSGTNSESYFDKVFRNFLESAIVTAVDTVFQAPVGSIASCLAVDPDRVSLPEGVDFWLDANANWIRKYVQVYQESTQIWLSKFSTDYVVITTELYGEYYDMFDEGFVSKYNKETEYRYADHYNDLEYCNNIAARCQYRGTQDNEWVGNAYIYNPFPNFNEDNEIDPLDPYLYSEPVISLLQTMIAAP